MRIFLGIDVGSITTKIAALKDDLSIQETTIVKTKGRPKEAVKEALAILIEKLPQGAQKAAIAVTGSARKLIGEMVGADVIKNEIIAQGVASIHLVKDVKTVIELGGQDSKLIIIENGVIVDFAMNTICAAGTGSFLDHQAERLGIKIEDFGAMALRSTARVDVAGRCTVFAESDMIHNAQSGAKTEDILAGLCRAIARNYINNLARGKRLLAPVVFQGGVASNAAVKKSFEEELGCSIIVPNFHNLTGAIGAAMLAKEESHICAPSCLD